MAEATPSLALAVRSSVSPRRGWVWGWIVAAVVALIYFAWAGSNPATWPRELTLWTFNKSGWIIPARGLGQLLLAAALLYAVLCGLARRAMKGPALSGMTRWLAAAFILIIALEIRLILLHTWLPIDFNAVVPPSHMGWSIVATIADTVSLTLLLILLTIRRQSLWLAALFGWHPIALLVGSVNGQWIACLLPVLILAAFPWRWQRWMRELLILTPAALALWWVAHASLAMGGSANNLLAFCLGDLGIEGRVQAQILIASAAILEAWVIFVAFKRRWAVARIWVHILLICVLVSPKVDFNLLLPLVALTPLYFVPAAWIISGTALGLFLLKPAGGNPEGEWLVFLIYTSAWVVEAGELAAATAGARVSAPPAMVSSAG